MKLETGDVCGGELPLLSRTQLGVVICAPILRWEESLMPGQLYA